MCYKCGKEPANPRQNRIWRKVYQNEHNIWPGQEHLSERVRNAQPEPKDLPPSPGDDWQDPKPPSGPKKPPEGDTPLGGIDWPSGRPRL